MLGQHVLDRIGVQAGRRLVLDPVEQVEVSVSVQAADISGAQPTVTRYDHAILVVETLAHLLRRARPHLAGAVGGHLAAVAVTDADCWNELTTRGIKTERRARRRQDQVPGARSGSA
ncbi:hypothetical protein [Nonomuraea sp. NPDC003709]|uniref:hypothetical protein n=1 Tax=Nonomuraea sp. NPDC003709 TaxID=3154450 RepID=UPI0033BE44D2